MSRFSIKKTDHCQFDIWHRHFTKLAAIAMEAMVLLALGVIRTKTEPPGHAMVGSPWCHDHCLEAI
jgi:hypothetical protein